MQRIWQKITEEWSCARKHLVAFWHFHTFVCIRKVNQPWTATKNSLQEKNTGKCMESSKHDCWHSYIPPIFFLNILFLVPKVFQFMNFSEAIFYENYLTSDFNTNTVISSLFAYLQNGVENRDKAYWRMLLDPKKARLLKSWIWLYQLKIKILELCIQSASYKCNNFTCWIPQSK